jgi:hypothetical protein
MMAVRLIAFDASESVTTRILKICYYDPSMTLTIFPQYTAKAAQIVVNNPLKTVIGV